MAVADGAGTSKAGDILGVDGHLGSQRTSWVVHVSELVESAQRKSRPSPCRRDSELYGGVARKFPGAGCSPSLVSWSKSVGLVARTDNGGDAARFSFIQDPKQYVVAEVEGVPGDDNGVLLRAIGPFISIAQKALQRRRDFTR